MGSSISMITCEKCKGLGYIDYDYKEGVKITGCDSCGYLKKEYDMERNIYKIGKEFLKQKRMSGAKTVSRILEEYKQETLEYKFQSWNELIKEVGSEEELLRILKLPHIAPLVREAMMSNCKNK